MKQMKVVMHPHSLPMTLSQCCVYVFFSIQFFISLTLSSSRPLSCKTNIYSSTYLPIYLIIYSFLNQFIFISIHLPICPSNYFLHKHSHFSTHSSTDSLSVYQFTCLSIMYILLSILLFLYFILFIYHSF